MQTTTFQRATAAAATLVGELFGDSDLPAPDVAVSSQSAQGVIVPDRYRLSDQELREDIGTYTGRVRSPRFTAVTTAVAATAAAPSALDLSAEASPSVIGIAEHLRSLHIAFGLRQAHIEEAGAVTAVGDVLWQPDRLSGETVAAMAVWELLPRIDGGLIPRSVTDDAGELLAELLPPPQLARFQKLWRAALSGQPTQVSGPTVLHWLSLASQWATLHHEMFPNTALPEKVDPAGVLVWPENPSGDPLGRHLSAALRAASRQHQQRAQEMSGHLANPAAAASVGRVHGGTAGGAGGTMTSGRRVVAWRDPTEQDLKNRRTFTRGLVVAGHRSPSMSPTPVAHPSGRLNTRQLVARSAQMSQGLPITAKPWTAMRSTPRTSVRLRLAVIVDASATMQRWAQTTAPLGWAAAHATAELGGLHTLWGFGGEAFPIVTSGIAPTKVPVVLDPGSGSAGAGTAITAAIADLTGDGVGLIVVVTDGDLPDPSDVQDAVDDAVTGGFTVLWVMPDRLPDRLRPRQARILDGQFPGTVAEEISTAVFSLLTGTTT